MVLLEFFSGSSLHGPTRWAVHALFIRTSRSVCCDHHHGSMELIFCGFLGVSGRFPQVCSLVSALYAEIDGVDECRFDVAFWEYA